MTCDICLEAFSVSNYSFEILDVNAYVQFFLDFEIFEIDIINGDRSL